MLKSRLTLLVTMARKMTAAQLLITVTSCLAINLVTDPDPSLRMIGACIGLAGQPLWVHSTLKNDQPGMLIVSIVFTYSYLRGLFPALPGLF